MPDGRAGWPRSTPARSRSSTDGASSTRAGADVGAALAPRPLPALRGRRGGPHAPPMATAVACASTSFRASTTRCWRSAATCASRAMRRSDRRLAGGWSTRSRAHGRAGKPRRRHLWSRPAVRGRCDRAAGVGLRGLRARERLRHPARARRGRATRGRRGAGGARLRAHASPRPRLRVRPPAICSGPRDRPPARRGTTEKHGRKDPTDDERQPSRPPATGHKHDDSQGHPVADNQNSAPR